MRAALARASSADLFGVLPQGSATQLGPTWPGGVDLSTGQWQQLALGRASGAVTVLVRTGSRRSGRPTSSWSSTGAGSPRRARTRT
ncbi:hypothetical protein ACWDWO_26115 [Actinopolymorpha singaporensis]